MDEVEACLDIFNDLMLQRLEDIFSKCVFRIGSGVSILPIIRFLEVCN